MISATYLSGPTSMPFADRLQELRLKAGLTQRQLAEQVELSVMQVSRYESGKTQPTLDVIKRLAQALSVTADDLVFDPDERGPSPDLALEFERISRFSDDEKKFVKGVLKGLILKHDAESL